MSKPANVETAIYDILVNDAAVAALVATRIYPNLLPQTATLPAITYQQITARRNPTMDGPAALVRFRFQLVCWAAAHNGATSLADAVRKAMDGHTATTIVDMVSLIDEADALENIAGLDVAKKYGKRLDFYIWSVEIVVPKKDRERGI